MSSGRSRRCPPSQSPHPKLQFTKTGLITLITLIARCNPPFVPFAPFCGHSLVPTFPTPISKIHFDYLDRLHPPTPFPPFRSPVSALRFRQIYFDSTGPSGLSPCHPFTLSPTLSRFPVSLGSPRFGRIHPECKTAFGSPAVAGDQTAQTPGSFEFPSFFASLEQAKRVETAPLCGHSASDTIWCDSLRFGRIHFDSV